MMPRRKIVLDPLKASPGRLWVTPSECFIVRVANPDGQYVSQLCRYVVASGDDGEAEMGLSIAHDPKNPLPIAPYEIAFEDLEFTVVKARDLVSVTPYKPARDVIAKA